MENYEQKYKAALGWVQSLYKGLHGTTKEDAEHYFPELKESEDERIREELISFVRNDGWKFIKLTNEEKNSWIAWLEKQGEQKTAWSKEDNKMLNSVIQRIKQLDHYWNKPTDEKMIDWLKSLKPHWKPSEEQMHALETAIYCRTMPWEKLLTLYNDLEKL